MKYNNEFKGLDQGVEHTWSKETLLGGLKAIAKHQPVMHRDPDSPFYLEMESKFPKKTWRAYDKKDGSFRPVFRRSNTWKKLGLIKEADKSFTLTLIGEQLLNGEISIEDVFSNVCRNHFEHDERPFIIIASILLEVSKVNETISVDELTVLLHNWRSGDSFSDLYSKKGLAPNLPFDSTHYDTRKRRISSMSKILASMGAVSLSSGYVKIKDKSFLEDLVGRPLSVATVGSYENSSGEDSESEGKKSITLNKREVNGKRDVSEFINRAGKVSESNHIERLRLLERATQRHEDVVSLLGDFFSQLGYTSYDDPNFYDLYVDNGQKGLLFEVKTVHKKNINKQIREAVSQLYEYRFRCRTSMCESIELIICLDRTPEGLMEPWLFDYLEQDRNIRLVWFEGKELVDSDKIIALLD